MISWKDTIVPTLSLFTSFGTLICCALPALFVSLGMGAAVAGIVSEVPELIWLSERKGIVFSVAAILIVISAILQYRQRFAPCPADPKKAKACMRLRRVSFILTILSGVIIAIGAGFAYLGVYFIS